MDDFLGFRSWSLFDGKVRNEAGHGQQVFVKMIASEARIALDQMSALGPGCFKTPAVFSI
jgi:hypothetical protein